MGGGDAGKKQSRPFLDEGKIGSHFLMLSPPNWLLAVM
jgi:hypothetical protein